MSCSAEVLGRAIARYGGQRQTLRRPHSRVALAAREAHMLPWALASPPPTRAPAAWASYRVLWYCARP